MRKEVMMMLYVTHDMYKVVPTDGVYVMDTDDNTVEFANISMLDRAVSSGIYIGGLDSVHPLVVRKAKRKPFLYDYCKANGLNFLDELDDTLDAKSITIGTKVDVHWKCYKGHKWVARLDSRIRYNQGCPYCCRETGNGTSFSEQRYFYYLHKYIKDLQNRVNLDGFEFDLYSKSFNLAIEYDGGYHSDSRLKRDIEKTEYANQSGITLIRIRGRGSTDYDFDCITYNEASLGYIFIIKDILRFLGFNYLEFIPDDNDQYIIYSAYKQRNKNSVLNTKPEMLKTYAYELNKDLDLNIISKASEIKAYWYCAICGKPYLRSFHQLNKGFDTCSNCKDLKMLLSRIKLYGNALSDNFPKLRNWYSDSNKYPFYALQTNSNQILQFKCPCCGYEFNERLANIINRGYIYCNQCDSTLQMSEGGDANVRSQ